MGEDELRTVDRMQETPNELSLRDIGPASCSPGWFRASSDGGSDVGPT